MSEQDQGLLVKRIYSEDKKESDTLILDKESQEKTQEYQVKSKPYLGDYLSAKKKLTAFERTIQPKPRRTRRSLDAPVLEKLTQEERRAIWEMYQLFEQIEKEQQNLTPRLQKIDEKIIIAELTKNRPTQSSIRSNLDQIKWITEREIKYENKPPKRRVGKRGLKSNFQSWEKWSDNPFHSFMDEIAYKSLMDKIAKTQEEKTIQARRSFVSRGMRVYVRPSAEMKRQEVIAKQAKEAVENTVALKFLEWMNQTKNSSLLS